MLYFQGKLKEFKTPIALNGTPFQKQVWEELLKIPYGQTISYKDLAIAVGNPRGCRAVAQANGANNLAVIIPCHRVINHNGRIGGYGGGLDRKKWLLDLEIRIRI
jgi:AraC family transcriptional regulator of adaptative response/methylated-DNA-[protein]-cysteine methyltransferase